MVDFFVSWSIMTSASNFLRIPLMEKFFLGFPKPFTFQEMIFITELLVPSTQHYKPTVLDHLHCFEDVDVKQCPLQKPTLRTSFLVFVESKEFSLSTQNDRCCGSFHWAIKLNICILCNCKQHVLLFILSCCFCWNWIIRISNFPQVLMEETTISWDGEELATVGGPPKRQSSESKSVSAYKYQKDEGNQSQSRFLHQILNR